MTVPVLGFAGYSGVGKTTLLEQLVRELKGRGLRVGVLKHDVHGIQLDPPGKDSWRFSQAGADVTVLASPEKTVVFEARPLPFSRLLERMTGVDLILVEGYKTEAVPQIGLCRKSAGKPLPASPERYEAVVTDCPEEFQRETGGRIPCFRFDQTGELADFAVGFLGLSAQTSRRDPSE